MNFCEKQKNRNISKTVRDRAISTEFLTHRVVEKYSIQNLKNFQFSPFLAAILNFCEKRKNLNISETVRDRAIWTEFLTHRVVEEYSVQNFQFSPLLAAILDFCGKPKNVNISETVRDRAICTEFLTRRVVGKYSIQN